MADPTTADTVDAQDLVSRLAGLQAALDASDRPLETLVHAALGTIPGASGVSITTLRGRTFVTDAGTDQRTLDADRLQYDLDSGPCVDAIRRDEAYNPDDLEHDSRWPEFGRRVSHDLGINSCLSYQLAVDLRGHNSCLNIYAEDKAAFDEEARISGLVFATQAVSAITTEYATSKISNLEKALDGSREIGIAIGIIMSSHHLTREDAFGYLRLASQNSNQKLRDLASYVAETGVLPDSALPRRAPDDGDAVG